MPVVIPPQPCERAMTLDDVIQAWRKAIYEFEAAKEEQRKRGEK